MCMKGLMKAFMLKLGKSIEVVVDCCNASGDADAPSIEVHSAFVWFRSLVSSSFGFKMRLLPGLGDGDGNKRL